MGRSRSRGDASAGPRRPGAPASLPEGGRAESTRLHSPRGWAARAPSLRPGALSGSRPVPGLWPRLSAADFLRASTGLAHGRPPNKAWALWSASKFRLVEKLRENRGAALGPEPGEECRALPALQGRGPPSPQEPWSPCFPHLQRGSDSTGGNRRRAVGSPAGCTAPSRARRVEAARSWGSGGDGRRQGGRGRVRREDGAGAAGWGARARGDPRKRGGGRAESIR